MEAEKTVDKWIEHFEAERAKYVSRGFKSLATVADKRAQMARKVRERYSGGTWFSVTAILAMTVPK